MHLGLGRLLEHDERSRAFPAATAPSVRSVLHATHAPPLHQRRIGACTQFAGTRVLYTRPFFRANWRKLPKKTDVAAIEALALKLYSRTTEVDPFPGQWPPEDTGSSGLSACKVLKEQGYIAGYEWAFGFDHALAALALAPVMVGINWRDDMGSPNASGLVTYTGEFIGGHQVAAVGIDVKLRLVWFWNSWGQQYGRGGMFAMTWDDFAQALRDRGDVVRPIAIGRLAA